ncbi:hypothetical protein [Caballeronia sordidicola]|jgi:hypothetical protein|uniref:hypothetical protein n=1 Tax=Caballeronia sordidicola TaxID=196367 RepID=UPI0004CFF76F|nr:hypothetical protein [Caballeronia sordidicola]
MPKAKATRQRAHEKRKLPPEEPGKVLTPAGPLPKDQVHQVGPDQMVVRNEDGSYSIVRKR